MADINLLRKTAEVATGIYSGLLDLVYPPFCLTCETAGGSYFCAKCEETIDLIQPPCCYKCGTPSESFLCSDCKEREFAFERARSAGVYDGKLRDAIHALKYNHHEALAEPLGDILARCFPPTGMLGKVSLVVPIPIHRSRLVDRGFNQAVELARRFCKRTGLRLDTNALRKPRETRHQVDLSWEERQVNLEGAFVVAGPNRVIGERVLLIDDVMTTGATLHEAARTLRAAGASEVCGYTLARMV